MDLQLEPMLMTCSYVSNENGSTKQTEVTVEVSIELYCLHSSQRALPSQF